MVRGKVSLRGARTDYGVVIGGADVDQGATKALRAEMSDARPADPPFFDRGPGYATLSGGRAAAELDYL